MKRLIILILTLLIGILCVGCEKEVIKEIVGPTIYDTTIVYDYDTTWYDTMTIIDTIYIPSYVFSNGIIKLITTTIYDYRTGNIGVRTKITNLTDDWYIQKVRAKCILTLKDGKQIYSNEYQIVHPLAKGLLPQQTTICTFPIYLVDPNEIDSINYEVILIE